MPNLFSKLISVLPNGGTYIDPEWPYVVLLSATFTLPEMYVPFRFLIIKFVFVSENFPALISNFSVGKSISSIASNEIIFSELPSFLKAPAGGGENGSDPWIAKTIWLKSSLLK